MRKAALLCPGPSLAHTWDDDFAAWTVGVNRAVRFAPDWWCAADWTTICRNEVPNGTRRLFTTLAAKQHLAAFDRPRLERFQEVLTWEELYEWLPAESCNWPTFSAVAGLVLCAWLGVREIQVFGADWKEGAADWDGHQDADNRRGAERWRDEVPIWNRTVSALAAKGVRVDRVRRVEVQ